MTAELPKEWTKVRLGDVISLNYGKSLSAAKRIDGDIEVFGSNGPVGTHIEAITRGQTLIVGRKGSFGEVHASDAPCFPIDTAYFVDQFDALDFQFAYYLLKQLPLKKLNRATAIPGLNREDAYGLRFGLPPLAEQKRIVAKVNSLLARVTRIREELGCASKLVAMAKAELLSAAVSGELTASWRRNQKLPEPLEAVLSNHVTNTSYGTSAKSSPSGSVPVLRMGNIQNGELDWTDLVFTSDSTEIEKYSLSEGDVLFNRTNSPELVGKSAYFDGSRVAIFAGYLIRVRCDATLDPKFLTFCLNSPQGREYSRKVKTDGVSQSNINAKKLQTYPLRLPSLREQAEIVRRLESALSTLARNNENNLNAIVELDILEQQILAKAFRGELVPQDPNDEPASTLLARVKAEREAAKSPALDRLPKAKRATFNTHTPRTPRIDAMTKTRTDDNVWHKPYLKSLLALEELIDDIDLSSELGIEPSGPREPEEVAQALFKKSELEIADFYKQLTWEIEAGHIVDDDGKLRVA